MGFWDSVRTGTLSVTGTIYELADFATLGVLPDTIQGVQISGQNSTNNAAAQAAAAAAEAARVAAEGAAAAAAAAGQIPPNLAAGLPQTGLYLGQGVGNLGYYSLAGIGGGLGAGSKDLFSGAGEGLGKGLLPIALIVFGGLLLLILATRGRSIKVGQGGGSLT